MQSLILWDIDGTLIRSRGARVSLGAFVHTLRATCGLDGELVYPSDVGGKTDPQIVLEMLLEHFPSERAEALLEAFAPVYHAHLEQQRAELTTDLRVLPGVVEALERLRGLHVRQSLLTGNLEPVARLKLACAHLSEYFEFELGAYGSDNRDRTCLVPIARERVLAATGAEPERVVVIGDTPRDIACARAGRARAVAVATGTYSRQELEAHEPDALLDDLSDTQAVVAAVLQYSTPRAPIV